MHGLWTSMVAVCTTTLRVTTILFVVSGQDSNLIFVIENEAKQSCKKIKKVGVINEKNPFDYDRLECWSDG